MQANDDGSAEQESLCEKKRFPPKAEIGGRLDVDHLSAAAAKQAKQLQSGEQRTKCFPHYPAGTIGSYILDAPTVEETVVPVNADRRRDPSLKVKGSSDHHNSGNGNHMPNLSIKTMSSIIIIRRGKMCANQ